MIEVHDDPEKALSDGNQSITPDAFGKLMESLRAYLELENKVIDKAE
jgi:3-deoxy-7-phosphoheptulonate synthase